MKRLIVVINDLEGSGKTSVSRAIYHHLANISDVKTYLVTSDEENIDEEMGMGYWDLDEGLSPRAVIKLLDKYDAVVADIHTGGARTWADFCDSTELDNRLSENGAEMTLVIPNTGGTRCNEEIFDLVELFNDSADYLITHLAMHDRDEIKWKGSDAEKAIRYLGCIDIKFPAISEDLETALESTGLELGSALLQASALPRFAEVQISQWLEKASSRLDVAAEYIQADSSEIALEY
jgi:hypothetical protein